MVFYTSGDIIKVTIYNIKGGKVMNSYVLGLDIGITSVGYGVIDLKTNNFVDYGVRLFKEGTAAENEARRSARGYA